MGILNRLLGRVIDATTIFGAVAVALMLLHISIDIVAKYVLGVPIPGTITVVSNFYMIIVSFLPLALVERCNEHIGVEVLVEHFSPVAQRALNVLTLVFSAVVLGAMTWQSFIEANRALAAGSFAIEHDMKLVIWPAKYLLPIGSGLMTITLVAKIFVALTKRSSLDLVKPYF